VLFAGDNKVLNLDEEKGVDIPTQTITPHLWFDKEAKEAAELYTSIFKDSKIKNTATLHNTPSGTVDLLTIELLGQEFRLINAGPLFKFTPAVSFLVGCDTKEEVDALWNELSKGARLSWNSANIRSARDTDGHKIDTGFHGR
jgi:predicted 3-demethylubiquinone-9 3-methyltransferase (glyoxalase superfamily)